mmetsp:Transcript_31499/g.60769  ORF Transcript_31499/g.60769 Transcript_31499/m.60769 type:complete len:127 (+) Transcript_31499:408-788(+)
MDISLHEHADLETRTVTILARARQPAKLDWVLMKWKFVHPFGISSHRSRKPFECFSGVSVSTINERAANRLCLKIDGRSGLWRGCCLTSKPAARRTVRRLGRELVGSGRDPEDTMKSSIDQTCVSV